MASCSQAPVVIRFREADPFDPSGAAVPADQSGDVTAVAANAVNDAWAASSQGLLPDPVTGVADVQVPHLYHWTDDDPPQAPAGDDNETRQPIVTQQDQTLYQIQPPVIVNPGPPRKTIIRRLRAKLRKVKRASPIYAVRAPILVPAGHGHYILTLSFKVRYRVTMGLLGLRNGVVVGSSGLHTFTSGTGRLVLTLTPQRWPNGLKFVLPTAKKR
jgi:hypothetical protein